MKPAIFEKSEYDMSDVRWDEKVGASNGVELGGQPVALK